MEPGKTEADEKLELVRKALEAPETPKFYANGFANALGMGDIVITFSTNYSPSVVINLSYTVAKTLSEKLAELIQHLEKSTGNTIMTTQEIEKALSEEKEK
jgi:hypothetical protein